MGEGSLKMTNVVRLHKEQAVQVIPAVEDNIDHGIEVGMPLLAPSIKRDEHNVPVERVLANIREKSSVMWIVTVGGDTVAAILTAVLKHPMRSTLFIEHVGGSRLDEWMPQAMDALLDLARKAELDGIEANGRPGFDKYLGKSVGWRRAYVHYELEL